MKTKRIIAAVCALTICLSAGAIPTARSGTTTLLTAIAGEIYSLEDADVSVDIENKKVHVTYDGADVPNTEYTLTFYMSETDEELGHDFPAALGKYYVSVDAVENSEICEDSIECSFEIIAPNIDLLNTDFTGVKTSTPKSWENETEYAEYQGKSGNRNDGIRLVLSSNCGIIVNATKQDYMASVIEATWNSSSDNSAKLMVYGSTTPYSAVSDLYDQSKHGRLLATLDVTNLKKNLADINMNYYSYIGICTSGGTVVLDDVRLSWMEENAPIDLDSAVVKVDKANKSVSVWYGDDEIPADAYDVVYVCNYDHSESTTFPTTPGGYYVKVTVRDGQTEYTGGNQNTYFTVDSIYTVTIPAKVKLGQTAEVKAEGVVLEIYRKLLVSMRSDFKLTDGAASVDYTVTNNTTDTQVTSGDVVLEVPEGTAQGSATLAFDVDEDTVKYAGNYTGTVTFIITIE